MSKRSCRLAVLAIVVCALAGCHSSQEAPCPSDQQLIDLFIASRASFAALVSDPDNRAVHSQIGIRRVTIRSTKPAVYWFEVWFHDFFGPGGTMKGFAYLEQPPGPGLLVANLDSSTAPLTPDEKELYRHIEGGWYLFFDSKN